MMNSRDTASVIGSGPNGLTAAIALAKAGVAVTVYEAADEVGGGARSTSASSGTMHDRCSAIHPFGTASPAFAALPLARHGLEWRWPDIDLAHPLDGGRVATLTRSVDDTASSLDGDGAVWLATFGSLARNFSDLTDDLLGPMLRIPRHPVTTARFGLRAIQSAETFMSRFKTDEARSLFAGVAAHGFQPFERAGTAATGLALAAAAHHVGWPVAAGGSGAISRALASHLDELGGVIETGTCIRSLSDLPPADLTLFDTAPAAVVDIVGDALPPRIGRAFRRWRRGPAAFKLDLVVDGGLPWTADPCRSAGTVHVGGTYDELAAALVDVDRGRLPDRPFVLVGQQYLADATRSRGDHHPVWAYAQVPHGFDGDATDSILDQIERFAPGARDRIVDLAVTTPSDLAARNANFSGGDISLGANTLRQTLFRPRVTLDPYSIGLPGMFLCSAATPPGPGVHGMCGWHAAKRALRHLGGSAAPAETSDP